MTTVIDTHTHILCDAWVNALREHGGDFSIKPVIGGQLAVHRKGAPFMTLTPGMLDPDLRLRMMNEAGIDLAVLSVTCPNVYWGGSDVSTRVAREVNDYMASVQTAHPDRFRWMMSLPWQYPDQALAELTRAHAQGAKGVTVLANVAGEPLSADRFAPIWDAIARAGLTVFVHPTVPPGADEMGMDEYNLVANIGFMFDTTLAFTRLIFDGFFERYQGIKLIAPHAGGTLPFLAGRLDQCWENMPACRVNLARRPSEVLLNLIYDAVVYEPGALEQCLRIGRAENMLFGSDYPHNIGDPHGCLARVRALPAGIRDDALGGNAIRLFGI